MPPSIRPSTLSSPITSCPSIRPRSIPQPARASRDFSQSSSRQITQRRRKFYAWLNGPGKALKHPLPGSTNYLGAYDKYGNLARADEQWQEKQKARERREAKEKTGAPKAEEIPEDDEAGEDMASRRLKEAGEENDGLRRTEEKDMKLPPETIEDLRPFPANTYFRSQPVLSEELREGIYQAMVDPHRPMSLQAASVHFGVSNERIGAVYRLKHLEKEWIAKVRLDHLQSSSPFL